MSLRLFIPVCASDRISKLTYPVRQKHGRPRPRTALAPRLTLPRRHPSPTTRPDNWHTMRHSLSTHCNTLQHTAAHRTALHHTAPHYTTLHHALRPHSRAHTPTLAQTHNAHALAARLATHATTLSSAQCHDTTCAPHTVQCVLGTFEICAK